MLVGVASPIVSQEAAKQEESASYLPTSGCFIDDAFLVATVFYKLDTDRDGWITQDEFFTFAYLVEFQEDEVEWSGDFLQVCDEHGEDLDVGVSLRTFSVFVLGTSARAPLCTAADLRRVLKNLPSCSIEDDDVTAESQAESNQVGSKLNRSKS